MKYYNIKIKDNITQNDYMSKRNLKNLLIKFISQMKVRMRDFSCFQFSKKVMYFDF